MLFYLLLASINYILTCECS